MGYRWVRFTDGKEGCFGSTEAAKQYAADNSIGIETDLSLPYAANPKLDPAILGDPAFCYRPRDCKGRSSCPQSRSCTD